MSDDTVWVFRYAGGVGVLALVGIIVIALESRNAEWKIALALVTGAVTVIYSAVVAAIHENVVHYISRCRDRPSLVHAGPLAIIPGCATFLMPIASPCYPCAIAVTAPLVVGLVCISIWAFGKVDTA